jgi:hypothetical protein
MVDVFNFQEQSSHIHYLIAPDKSRISFHIERFLFASRKTCHLLHGLVITSTFSNEEIRECPGGTGRECTRIDNERKGISIDSVNN